MGQCCSNVIDMDFEKIKENVRYCGTENIYKLFKNQFRGSIFFSLEYHCKIYEYVVEKKGYNNFFLYRASGNRTFKYHSYPIHYTDGISRETLNFSYSYPLSIKYGQIFFAGTYYGIVPKKFNPGKKILKFKKPQKLKQLDPSLEMMSSILKFLPHSLLKQWGPQQEKLKFHILEENRYLISGPFEYSIYLDTKLSIFFEAKFFYFSERAVHKNG